MSQPPEAERCDKWQDGARCLLVRFHAESTREQAALRAVVEAMRKVRGHTSYVNPPTMELLQGLLASIERIA